MFEVKIKQLSAAKEDTDKKVIENETKTKMTARQPHGETTNGADIKQIHIKPEEQELQATTRTSSCETRRVGDAAELKILQFPRWRARTVKNSKIGGRTPNASHNCSDKKQHPEELQGIQTEDEELLKIEPIELKKEIKLLRKMFRACSTSTSTTSPATMEIEVKTEPEG